MIIHCMTCDACIAGDAYLVGAPGLTQYSIHHFFSDLLFCVHDYKFRTMEHYFFFFLIYIYHAQFHHFFERKNTICLMGKK
jgi:hypothetical protein